VSDVPAPLADALRDRYALERELGRGGMATVYLATDLRHKRRVALKVLDPAIGALLGRERFLREIETAAQLQHPHILPVHDSGDAAGLLWYTMPFVEGESLRDRLRRDRRLPVAEAVRLGREIAGALDHAHRKGVIHRDIKPENILLSDGQALVADFGIARTSTPGGETLTQTGFSLGTPAYMSPEQAMGDRAVDGRSDQYALGCLIFELAAGQPPYTGATSQAVVARHLTDPVPALSAVRPDVPAGVSAAVQRAMTKTPDERFPTAGAFGEALGAGL
jgi:serine/threonine protein kinase